MYDDYDFNQEDDFQMLVEGRCSDDEEFFKNEKAKRQSSQKSSKSKRSPASKPVNQRKHLPIDEDSNSRNSLANTDEYGDKYDRLDKFEKYSKYDNDKFSDDDPVNPFDEAEEEVDKKSKEMGKEGEEKAKRKNIVRNPRVMLNDEKLKSTDGVIKLPELFKEVKFKGKNYEKEDLNRIMGVYQNWSHRLMPSLQFDDFIEKTEILCRKAKMKVFLTKIRNNMPLDIRGDKPQSEEVINQFDDSQDEEFNQAPTMLPKTNMEDEFMDDDFMMDDEDNKLLNEKLFDSNKMVDTTQNKSRCEEVDVELTGENQAELNDQNKEVISVENESKQNRQPENDNFE